MISEPIFFNVIVLTIAALQVFDQAYLLFWRDQTNASPESSLFYGVYLFQQAFRQFNFGFASAMAWLLFVIILVISLIQVKVGNRFVYYEGGQLTMSTTQSSAAPSAATAERRRACPRSDDAVQDARPRARGRRLTAGPHRARSCCGRC